MSSHVIEGTWEEIKRHEAELIGHYLRVTIKPPKAITRKPRQAKTDTAFGKYAFVSGGSEEFAKEKQAEIDREDRAR